MRFFIFCLMMPLLLVSCVTPTPFQIQKKAAQWDAKAQLSEDKTGKTNQASLSIVGIWPSQIRLDASAYGVSGASLAVDGDQFQLALLRQKKFYQGKASEKVMRLIFHFAFDPHWLLNISFDQPIQESGWSCRNDAQGVVQKCERSSDQLSITWQDREGERKRVIIRSPGYELQIVYKNFSSWDATKVQENSTPFHLNAPAGFALYNNF